MTDKIESLTPEQEAQMIAYRDEWLAKGRSTEPADRPTTEAALKAMYAHLGKEEPFVWWVDGPISGSLIRGYLTNKYGEKRFDFRVEHALMEGARTIEEVKSYIGKTADSKKFQTTYESCKSWSFWGQHEAYWPAYYAWPHLYLRPMHTDEQMEQLQWWLDLASSCGWWMPYEGCVFVCERPSRQDVDDRGRLHRENGPALECRDGQQVFMWHGVSVPEYVITEPNKITGETVLKEANAEVRAVMLQRRPLALTEMPGVETIHEDSVNLDPITPPPGISTRLADEIATYADSHPRPESMVRRLIKVPMADHEDGFVKALVFEDPAEGGTMGVLLAHNRDRNGKEVATCQSAVAASYGLVQDEYPAEMEALRR